MTKPPPLPYEPPSHVHVPPPAPSPVATGVKIYLCILAIAFGIPVVLALVGIVGCAVVGHLVSR